MDDKKYFDMEDELMIDFAEMTSFNFESPDYLAFSSEREIPSEFAPSKMSFKAGGYDVLEIIQSMISKVNFSKR